MDMLSKSFPLHCACMMGDERWLSALLGRGENGVYIEDDINGWTPIHYASFYGQLECLITLHQYGTHHDSPTIRLRQTPAHMASLSGKILCLKWLVNLGIAINRQDYLNETVLHKVARGGSVECAEFLLLHGADKSIRNSAGLTPAELAASLNQEECFLIINENKNCAKNTTLDKNFGRKRKTFTNLFYSEFREIIKRSKIDLSEEDESDTSRLTNSYDKVLISHENSSSQKMIFESNEDLWQERDDFGAVFF